MGLRDGLPEGQARAAVADRHPAVDLVAELAAVDLPTAHRAREHHQLRSIRWLGSHHPELAFERRMSIAAFCASSLTRSPTSLPSDVVIGAFTRSCSDMNSAISSTGM